MVQQFQLKNGLKVLLVPSHKSPVVSFQTWVRTGSADERKKEEGISHFIEHLVFKGSEKYGVGEIASVVEGSGGELNAYTSFDQTVFYVTLSKKFSDVGLDVLSQMMGFPKFDKQEIDNEREVVIEEIKRGEDSPSRQASQLLFSTTFQKHPYGIPVIGYADNIRNVSDKILKKYYADRYSPQNMFLVVVGDFESKEMKSKVQDYFGKFKKTKVRKTKRSKEQLQKSPRVAFKQLNFQESTIYISWKIPGIKNKDIPALDVLALILGQGDSSRLVKKLRIDQPVCNSVGAFTFAPQDVGLFAISSGLRSENLQKFFDGVLAEVKEILVNPPSFLELQKSVTNLSSEPIYSMESVDGLARQIGNLEFSMKDPNYFPKYLKQVNALKPEDIVKVAKKYLTFETLNLVMTSQEEQKQIMPALEKFKTDFKAMLKQVAEISKKKKSTKVKAKRLVPLKMKKVAATKEPKIEEIQFKNGLRMIYRHQPETPTVSLRAGFLGGVRAEEQKECGVSELFARTWTAGTTSLDENQISEKIDQMACGINAFSGRNTFGLSADFLSQFEKQVCDLYFDILINSVWPEQILEREKIILSHQIESKKDHPSSVCMTAFLASMFQGHPYSKDPQGTLESIKKIARTDLLAFGKKLMKSENMVFCIVGDFDLKLWKTRLEKLDQAWAGGETFKKEFPLAKISSPIKKFEEMNKEQTHIAYGFRGISLDSEERYTLEVIQSILAGQGGRLFIELRDKNSLAYSVSPIRMDGLGTGYFGAYIACSPEKTEKSLQMIQAEFDKLINEKVSEDELLRSQRYLAGRFDIDLQKKSSVSQSLFFDAIYGMDYNDLTKAAEKYFLVTPKDIQSVSKKIFSQVPVISIVGKKV